MAHAPITPDQVREYIDTGAIVCPHCGSPDIEASPDTFEGCEAYQAVSCNDCHATWTEVYTLSGIIDDDAPGIMEVIKAPVDVAAPELLEACERLVAWLDGTGITDDYDDIDGLTAARAAIAKARNT